jgi:uncharacterized damage-inducible protein DinB
MTMSELLLPEFDQEMATTRRVLARVPDDRADWKPHPKSFPLAHLAQLVATMPGWIATTLRQTEIDLAGSPGYGVHEVRSLLAQFDRLVADAHEALAASKDADFAVPWSLRNGPNVLFTTPRGTAVRMHLNHHVHHRAQLALYLRLLDVPVPSMYGPTADEPWGAGAAG